MERPRLRGKKQKAAKKNNMKPKNFIRTGLAALCVAALMMVASFSGEAQTGGTVGAPPAYGSTIVPVATNLFGPAPTNAILAGAAGSGNGFSMTFPTSYVYTNVYSNIYASPVTYTTNIVTNTVTGYIDTSKMWDVTFQIGFSSTNPTDVSNVIWQLFPSLDAINPDSANRTFWLTNTSPGSNTLVQSFVFSAAQKAGIAGFFLGQIVNNNTNPIFAALTNSTGSNYQFLQARGTKVPVY
jgi:hypothetical protein